MTWTQMPERLPVAVRPAGPADTDALTAMLRGLSPASGFRRFLVGFGEPKPGLVRALLATGPRRGALLAVLPDGRAVGHACWTVDASDVVDVGVVVTDAFQRRGLGRALMTTAVDAARAVGATALHVDVHPENRHVVRMLRERLLGARCGFTDGLVQFDVALATLLAPAVPEEAYSPAASQP